LDYQEIRFGRNDRRTVSMHSVLNRH